MRKSELRQIIREEIERLTEVRILKRRVDQETKPLKDSDTIRVYHGFGRYSKHYAFLTAEFGILGNERIGRAYSYEATNNPKGLFVSAHLEAVLKTFAGSGIVIEFHTKVSDLEAPVWNSEHGSWFGANTRTSGFSGKGAEFDAKRNKRRIQNRRKIKMSDDAFDIVKNSDRPELAHSLMAVGEKQALFTGALNPNMIRAFWVMPYRISGGKEPSERWERVSPKEFKQRFSKYGDEMFNNPGKSSRDHDDLYNLTSERLLKPNDDIRTYRNAYKILKRAYENEKKTGEGWVKDLTSFESWLFEIYDFLKYERQFHKMDLGVFTRKQEQQFFKFVKEYKAKNKV